MSKLVIVESPNKIKKIKSILGDDYNVLASVGHIIDLDAESMSVDIKNNFTPTYAINKDKKDVVKKLKKAVEDADEVLLATDGDREGEMIAWSLAETLKLKNPKRIIFYSITKKELEEAVKNPRSLNYELINAQKSRRILDRIVGYEISPVLWKSIKASLSAGRVQSVVTRLIIDKENEINDFFKQDENTYFKFYGNFLDSKNNIFKTVLYNNVQQGGKKKKIITISSDTSQSVSEDDLEESDDKDTSGIAKIVGKNNANKLMITLTKSLYTIGNIQNKLSIRNPSPPFTTSTLQQEAGRKLGFAIKRTDNAAQKLHHAGYITYIRTDSVSLSEESLQNIKKYVNETYGQKYYRRMQYKSKSNNTQEAHEAIRPTDVFRENIENMGNDEIRLYSLIWKRTVASQMSPAKFNQKIINIDIDKLKDYIFSTMTEKIDFNGFLAVYNINNIDEDTQSDEPNNTLYDTIQDIGIELKIDNLSGTQDYDRPNTRYTEATLVKILDPSKLNIGRPATYSNIINKIQDRGYVEKKNIDGVKKEIVQWSFTPKKNKIEEKTGEITIGKETNKLVPTPTGKMVTEFLIKYFPEIMEYKFTADMEDKLDNVAEGKLNWIKMLDDFYCKFHPCVEKIIDKPINIIDESTRILGLHPQFGVEIHAMNGKYGAMLKMNDPNSKSKSIYAPIKKPLTLETITLDEALKILEYPKNLGKYKRSHIILNKGQYGYYLKVSDSNYQVKEDEYKPDELTFEQAIEIIQKGEQLQEDKLKANLWNGKDDLHIYAVKEGQYGKYIQIDSITKTKSKTKKKPTFVKFPKDIEITDLSLEKIKHIISKHNKSVRDTKKASDTSDSVNSVQSTDKKKMDIAKKIITKETSAKPVKKVIVKKTINKKSSTKKISSNDFEEA
jgi:DNA topoisomerase-1